MAKAILICGKICSGKTTYANRLAAESRAVLLSVDEITLALFGQHIGEKHDEMCERTQNYLFDKAVEIIVAGIDVIFDWGFWTSQERQYAAHFFTDKGIPVEWHYIDVRDDVWRKNLVKRNDRIATGQDNFYFIDDNVAAKFSRIFETPKRIDIDVWFENCPTDDEKASKVNQTSVEPQFVVEKTPSQKTIDQFVSIIRSYAGEYFTDNFSDDAASDAPFQRLCYLQIGGELAAGIMFTCLDGRPHITAMATKREIKNKGYGKTLMERFTQYVSELGFHDIELYAWSEKTKPICASTQAFYKGAGFVVDQEYMGLWAQDMITVKMRKTW